MKVHIAGIPIRVESELRQLCAWCGYRLIDMNLEHIAAPNGLSEIGAGPLTWSPNALVAVDGPVQWLVQLDEGPGARLPRECCAWSLPPLKLLPGAS